MRHSEVHGRARWRRSSACALAGETARRKRLPYLAGESLTRRLESQETSQAAKVFSMCNTRLGGREVAHHKHHAALDQVPRVGSSDLDWFRFIPPAPNT